MHDEPKGAHLVGTVPLADAEAVYRMTASVLGRHLRRVTDGETGPRLNWIGSQLGWLMSHPQLDVVPPDPDRGVPYPRVKRKPDVEPGELRFTSLGYARAARDSYAVFSQLQAEGVVPSHWRFQVSLPTPLAPIAIFVVFEDQAECEHPYEAATRAELDEILSVVPHDRLAIQWDTAVEIRMLEGVTPPYFPDMEAGIHERLVRYGSWVPDDVPLGFHLCYGDEGHKHFTEPGDAGRLVGVANAVCAGLERPVDWMHLPVPRDRDDADYFRPLAGLDLDPRTDLFLGLVHLTDGVEGTRRRIASAQRVVSEFGVATECGLGRRPPETIPRLLEIHAEVAAAVV
jgi:hypothetical protein